MAPDEWLAVKAAASAAGVGSAARIALALHGGMRSPVALAIEGFVGAMLGMCTAGVAIWWEPSLQDAGWGLYKACAFAGLGGALGTRLLKIVEGALRARLG